MMDRSRSPGAWVRAAVCLFLALACSSGNVAPGGQPSVAIGPASPALFEGDSLQLTANVRDGSGNAVAHPAVAWSSSAPAVASVDPASGLVLGVAPGPATITATSMGASASALVTVRSLGTLKGSTNFAGPYPSAVHVSYVDAAGASKSVLAYPGQVILIFDVANSGGTDPSAVARRESAISANQGTVLEKIPQLGFYLVKVASGQESAFIQALRGGSITVSAAAPNGATVRGEEPPLIDECWLSNCTSGSPATKYVPLNVGGGMVVLDDFNMFQGENHGEDVYQTAANNGGSVSARVQLPVSTDGSIPLDKIAASVAAIQQGAGEFLPGQDVIANLSFNASGEHTATYGDNWTAMAAIVDATIEQVNGQLPTDQKSHFLLVEEIGNSQQDISADFGKTRLAEQSAGVAGNHVFVGGSDGTYSTQVNDSTLHNEAAWYPGCIQAGLCGSSFASPAVAAFIDQVARRGHVSLDGARSAVLQALIDHPGASASDIVSAALAIVTRQSPDGGVNDGGPTDGGGANDGGPAPDGGPSDGGHADGGSICCCFFDVNVGGGEWLCYNAQEPSPYVCANNWPQCCSNPYTVCP